MKWLLVVFVVICLALTLLNGYMYALHGAAISLIAFVICGICTVWTLSNTLKVWMLDD